MICKSAVLDRALSNYRRYKPSASVHLIRCRDRWIPCQILLKADRTLVRNVAEDLLRGRPYAEQYWRLPLELQLGVCLAACQGWSELLAAMPEGHQSRVWKYTGRLFEHLAGVSVDFQALAVRNCSSRDGGGEMGFKTAQQWRLADVPVFLQVCRSIRDHWTRVGLDGDRRPRPTGTYPWTEPRAPWVPIDNPGARHVQ
jgi:hypothetical protein